MVLYRCGRKRLLETTDGTEELCAESGGVRVDEIDRLELPHSPIAAFVLTLDKARGERALFGAVGAFRGNHFRRGERLHHMLDPVWIGNAVRIGEEEDLPLRAAGAVIPSDGRTGTRNRQHIRPGRSR